MEGVFVTVAVSVGGEFVFDGVIARYAFVCITDQVWAARVSGRPGICMTLLETRSHDMLKMTIIRNNNPIR
jgi:hypothetical protein